MIGVVRPTICSGSACPGGIAGLARRARLIGVLLLLLAGPAAVQADTITLRGSSIGMRGVVIEDVRSGRVFYRDQRGRRHWRELDEVDTIGFDDLPALDRAETQFGDGDTDAALASMLQALVSTDDELRRLWVHVRLLRLHVAREETVAAASHFASVAQLREDPWWRFVEPNAPMTTTRLAVTAEAERRLDAAARTVETAELRAVVCRLRERLRPVHEAAKKNGGSAPTGETYSGYTLDAIRAGVNGSTPAPGEATTAARSASPAPRPAVPAPDAKTPPPRPSAGSATRDDPPSPRSTAARSSASGDSLDALEALFDAGDTAGAIAACERIAADPGRRSLSRFLYQYGRALLLDDRPRDAAVMFLRCALLYEDDDEAAPSLIAAAWIHLDRLDRPRAARRLLDRAVVLAAGRSDVLASAHALLERIPMDAPDETSP